MQNLSLLRLFSSDIQIQNEYYNYGELVFVL